ncbi:MAG: hypothetical protein JO061_03075 [Acidobacteriaceae bacterium]|nr:hypothetical protein [Acidobacteriaceae bacterium]
MFIFLLTSIANKFIYESRCDLYRIANFTLGRNQSNEERNQKELKQLEDRGEESCKEVSGQEEEVTAIRSDGSDSDNLRPRVSRGLFIFQPAF